MDEECKSPGSVDDLLRQTGTIGVDFGTLEFTVSFGIISPIRSCGYDRTVEPLSDIAMACVAELDLHRKLNLLERVFRRLVEDEEQREAMRSLCSRARAIASRRNDLTHSGWMWPTGDGTPMAVRIDRRGRAKMEDADPVENEKLHAELLELIAQLPKVLGETGRLPKTGPGGSTDSDGYIGSPMRPPTER